MAAESSDKPAAAHVPLEDEIDLRAAILTLWAWRWEILLITVGCMVLAGGAILALRWIMPPSYEAGAVVAIARTRSDITFDERFRTVTEEDLAIQQSRDALSARQASLVGLVNNGGVANAVLARLGDRFPVEERTPAQLMQRIAAELVTPAASRTAGDLIRITATAPTPDLAAELATAWAEEYVTYVNRLYGALPANLEESIQTELAQAQADYNTAQRALEAFIAENQSDRLQRLIGEKQDLIESLQAGKQTAIRTIVDEELRARRELVSAYINAQAQNRLLAFEQEQEAKRTLVATLMETEAANRLTAYQRDQQARRQLFDQYVTAEIRNRLAALETEQETKRALFDAYTDADRRTKVTLFTEQVQERLARFTGDYEERRRLARLRDQAAALQSQIDQAGPAGATANAVALLLLKTDIFAANGADLQLLLDDLPGLTQDAGAQADDVAGLVQTLDRQIEALDTRIARQAETLFTNQGYDLPQSARADDDPLHAAIQEQYLAFFQVDDLAADATAHGETELSQAIQDKYAGLFGLGPLVSASQTLTTTTPLFQAIRTQYPELFSPGDLSTLTEQTAADNPLALLGTERAQQLLQLEGLEQLPDYTAATAPLAQAVDRLEAEIQTLQAQQAAEAARRQELTQQRDLAWSTLGTLRNKNAELQLTGTAADSEVRFAAPAVEPSQPVAGLSLLMALALAGAAGFLLAIFLVFLAALLHMTPRLARQGA